MLLHRGISALPLLYSINTENQPVYQIFYLLRVDPSPTKRIGPSFSITNARHMKSGIGWAIFLPNDDLTVRIGNIVRRRAAVEDQRQGDGADPAQVHGEGHNQLPGGVQGPGEPP